MAGQRPGGLTALAVINFVGAGLNLLASFRNIYRLAVLDKFKADFDKALGEAPENTRALLGGLLPPDWWFFFKALIAPTLLSLLLISGIGYLKRRRKMGRRIGNLYAVTSIGESLVDIAIAGAMSSMFDVVFMVYPLMTLVVLNFVFKDDFE
jgi:hypothetical protein